MTNGPAVELLQQTTAAALGTKGTMTLCEQLAGFDRVSKPIRRCAKPFAHRTVSQNMRSSRTSWSATYRRMAGSSLVPPIGPNPWSGRHCRHASGRDNGLRRCWDRPNRAAPVDVPST
jgi:hypothetical protein